MEIGEFIIAVIAIVFGCSIPLVAIIGGHKRQSKQISLQIIREQIELENKKLEVYEKETEKLRLEVQNQQLLLNNNSSEYKST